MGVGVGAGVGAGVGVGDKLVIPEGTPEEATVATGVAGVVVEVFAVGVDPGNVAMPIVAGLAKLAMYWLTTAGFALVALVAAATAAGSFTLMLFWAM